MSDGSTYCDLHPLLRRDLPQFDLLAGLALNLRCSWNHQADFLWKTLSPGLWENTHNPCVVLQTVSKEQWERAFALPDFQALLNEIIAARQKEVQTPTWFSKNHSSAPLKAIAYFSMEFMLTEALPIYSGGLGNVAGDQLKSASDLGVPVMGVGLLYQQGYFRQVIGRDGEQQALFPYNDPGQLPITPLRQKNGEWLRIEITLPGHSIWLRTWQVQVGDNLLYLLDSNDAANFPAYRGITSELYGGDKELRLRQELILGIGGWRLLEALGIDPEVCHLNEGHAAFVVLERARSYMKKTGTSFQEALLITRAGNIFTTHTAVAAGFDHFPVSMIIQYLSKYALQQLHISIEELLSLGKDPLATGDESFNMAYLAMRGASRVNGVSKLHALVSKALFAPLFPRMPINEVPISSVTNGVHMPSWDSIQADQLWTAFCGKKRWLNACEKLGSEIAQVPDEVLWKMRQEARELFITKLRKRVIKQRAETGASFEEMTEAESYFRPNVCILGFARRFASYKRPNLLLRNPERLIQLLNHPRYPMQIVLAGKAHPADKIGQEMIREWNHFLQREEVRGKVLFLSDYDMQLTEQMVQGVDVWLNTPERPWEACGTSGMKVLVNGGLNVSVLDGWWAEAFSSDVGWALGLRKKGDLTLDEAAEELYDTLEEQVLPTFYRVDEAAIPREWTAMMRESMARLTPRFSANRAVREYTESYYIPAAKQFYERSVNSGAQGKQLAAWGLMIDTLWPGVRFGVRHVQEIEGCYHFEISIDLNGISTDEVRLELYRQRDKEPAFTQEMQLAAVDVENKTVFLYRAEVPAEYSEKDYTARVMPLQPLLHLPLENNHITWQETS